MLFHVEQIAVTRNSIIDCIRVYLSFCSRFLVAIDRRNGAEVAMETVKLAEEFMLSSDGLVVGLDLSGDPTVSLLSGLDSLELIKI